MVGNMELTFHIIKFITSLKKTREEKTMSIEIPKEYVERVNIIKDNIVSLEGELTSIKTTRAALLDQGVEIKLVVRSIEEIDAKVPKMKAQFSKISQDKDIAIKNVEGQIQNMKTKLAQVITEALLQ
jgi:hypothetical protein